MFFINQTSTNQIKKYTPVPLKTGRRGRDKMREPANRWRPETVALPTPSRRLTLELGNPLPAAAAAAH